MLSIAFGHKFLPYSEASDLVLCALQAGELYAHPESYRQWQVDKPRVPIHPHLVYNRTGWQGWNHFLTERTKKNTSSVPDCNGVFVVLSPREAPPTSQQSGSLPPTRTLPAPEDHDSFEEICRRLQELSKDVGDGPGATNTPGDDQNTTTTIPVIATKGDTCRVRTRRLNRTGIAGTSVRLGRVPPRGEGKAAKKIKCSSSVDLGYLCWKGEVGDVFVDVLRNKGMLGSSVLVVDDGGTAPLLVARTIFAAAPRTRRVLYVTTGAKCRVLLDVCGRATSPASIRNKVNVVDKDPLEYLGKGPALPDVDGYLFDFNGNVERSIQALRLVRKRRPRGGYVIGITYTTKLDHNDLGISTPALLVAAEGHVPLRSVSFMPSLMHAQFFWVPSRQRRMSVDSQ